MTDQQILISGYRNRFFLANKLKQIFWNLKTDDEKAEHNAMLRDVLIIVGTDAEEFRLRVADIIIEIAQRNYGKTEEKEVSATAQRLR